MVYYDLEGGVGQQPARKQGYLPNKQGVRSQLDWRIVESKKAVQRFGEVGERYESFSIFKQVMDLC